MDRQFVLLPRQGLVAPFGPASQVLRNLPVVRSTEKPQTALIETAGKPSVRVLDTMYENGPKLVEIDAKAAAQLNGPASVVRALPVVVYPPPLALHPFPEPPGRFSVAAARPSGVAAPTVVTCSDDLTGRSVSGAHVVAFTDFARRAGAEGVTDAQGKVSLDLGGSVIERLYVYPTSGYWSAYRSGLAAANVSARLVPVDLSYKDCVRHYYAGSRFDATRGVKVGVIDSGIGPHGDLNVVGGSNTVTGELASDYTDSGTHGTHVAGLIGSRGAPPAGLRGLAPDLPLMSYRVFPSGQGATNYSILKAMIFAARDGCDIVNLSLGGGPFDEIVSEAIADARNQGMLVVIAAGNGGRKPVSYPAAYAGATAVAAMGREGTFPTDTVEAEDVERPPTGADPEEFLAAFSNVGSQIAVVAPGVGSLSTLPGNRFGPMSGTSMAAPVVAGAAACLLSRDPAIYSMNRDRARSDAITTLLQSNCVKRGFGSPIYEGYGMPDPNAV